MHKFLCQPALQRATRTGLEPATTGSTVRDSNQLSYRARAKRVFDAAREPPSDSKIYQNAVPATRHARLGRSRWHDRYTR